MDIERLKEAKDYIDKCLYHATNKEPWENSHKNVESHKTVVALIDEAIARQSATSEDVQRAIDWLATGDFEIIAGDEEYPANSSHHPNTSRFRKTAITALQAYQPWVSVEDRLPDDRIPVLVTYIGFNDGKLYSDGVAKWSIEENGYNGGWLWEIDGSETTVGITHWKPLPEPPKGE